MKCATDTCINDNERRDEGFCKECLDLADCRSWQWTLERWRKENEVLLLQRAWLQAETMPRYIPAPFPYPSIEKAPNGIYHVKVK